MGEEHVGSVVSVDCGSVLGVYEGRVLQVDSLLHTLTLKDPKRNGVVYPVAKVTLRAADIHDLKIIKLRSENGSTGSGGNDYHPNDNTNFRKSPKKQIHHSKSFQNTASIYKNDKTLLQRRRSQTPEPPFPQENDDDYNNAQSFNDFQDGVSSSNKHRAHSGGNQYKLNYNSNQNNFLLDEPLDMSEMDDDFDFEANLALFDKLEVKNLCDSLKIPERPKRNYRHDEFIIDNPADVYSSAKNTYKYVTETGASVCALSKNDKNQLFEQKIRCDQKQFDKFLHLYAYSAVQCVFNAIGTKPSYENLAALLIVDAAASPFVRELATETKNLLENKFMNVTYFDRDEEALHSKKYEFVLVFGINSTNFRCIEELSTDQMSPIIVVEIDSQVEFSAKKSHVKFKSSIFWHLPVSDCDVKSSCIYLCDVGLNPKNVAEIFHLKKYQDPFGAKCFVKLLKM